MPFHFNYEQKYPYTDFDKINLDWILELATQLKEAAENGDFDGPPGPPGSGTATNGIAYFTTSDTFADIQAAITDGQLPVLMYYNMGTPCFLYCFDHTNTSLKFGGLSGTQQLQLIWYANETKSFTTRTLIDNQAPEFYGFPRLVNSLPGGDSSNKLATTSFVQTTVTAAVQAAIEQLVIAPFSESFKQALLQLAQKVAYIDGNGQTYYQALYDAMYPPINVDSITAVWNPPVGYVVYTTTPIDSLKTNLTVTATYDDQSTAVLDPTDYVLSGTLTTGISVITVTYADATTTFNVYVVANEVDYITAVFTQGASVVYTTATLESLVPMLTVTATYTNLNTVYVDYPDYALSGVLTAGTSVITVSYAGKTTTFNVTVTSRYTYFDYLVNTRSSTGNNNDYVNTGLTFSPSFSTLNIEFEFENSNSESDSTRLFGSGAYPTATNASSFIAYARANKAGFSAYMLGVATQITDVPADTRSLVKYTFVNNDRSYFEYSNTQYLSGQVDKSTMNINDSALILCGGYRVNYPNTIYGIRGNGYAKLGYVKFTDPVTDEDLFNFVPAQDAVSLQYGYHDTVNDVFYPANTSYLQGGNWS